MDHADARELLELAAAEPEGLDRLVAGDTPEAAALAGHLAGCDTCREEFTRLRRTSSILRSSLAATPPPDLRARTLAYVAALGRDRSPGAVLSTTDVAALGSAGAAPVALRPARAPALVGARRIHDVRVPAWTMAVAAVLAVVLVAAGTAALVGRSHDRELQALREQVSDLSRVSAATIAIEGQRDAARVVLAGAAGSPANGTLLFSPTSRQLLIMATGLAQPPTGREYRCWVEVGGARVAVGRMFFAGDLAYWAGPVQALPEVASGTLFGVTLVDAAGSSLAGDPVISGQVRSS